jgi:murein DD-endopeptidase MepM/ murein hydrolase activator NlpD
VKKRRGFTLLIIPEGSTKSIRKRFSFATLYTVLAVAFIILGALLIMIVNYRRVYYVALQAEILRRRNVKLEEQWNKITRIEKDLSLIKRTDERIKKMLGAGMSPGPSVLSPSEGASTFEQTEVSLEGASDDGSRADPPAAVENPLQKIPTIWPARGWISRLWSQEHTAIDIAAATGTPVVSTTYGKVTRAGWDDRYGRIIQIENDQGFAIIYGHNSRLLVREGEIVSKGDVIAFVGSTGLSSAPHLHYEIHLKGKPVDPMRYLVH